MLWNESWYFDAVSEDGMLGVYVRLGLYPNMKVAWYTAYVTGPGRPAIAIVDLAAPVPTDDDLTTSTGRFTARHVCEAPDERFHLTLEGTGAAFEDHAAPLRGEEGQPVAVAVDLLWTTDGERYRYSILDRYEIPCTVAGTVSIGGRDLPLVGAGQRDHSWGVRDWWSVEWMWSALRLEDGTRFHALQLRRPDGSRPCVGYVQAPGMPLAELSSVQADEDFGIDGLISAAHIAAEPGDVALTVEPLGFGPLLFTSPEGAVTAFPRAMCRFTTTDGRTGLGWVEWGLNDSGPTSPVVP
jgi:hypothetical protein